MDALDAARDLLPLPVRYGSVLLVPLIAAVSTAAVLAVAWWFARPSLPADAHWTERARDYVSGRTVLAIGATLSLLAVIGAGMFNIGPMGILDQFSLIAVVTTTVTLTALPFYGAHQWRALPWLTRRRLRRGRIGYYLFRHSGVIPMVLVFALLPATPGPLFFAVLIPGLALWWYLVSGGGLRLAQRFGYFAPAPERVQQIVTSLATDADRPPPTVLVMQSHFANAFALPIGNMMFFSEHALEVLTDEEIGRIAAHEMSHLGEARGNTLLRLVPLLFPLLIMVARPASALLPGHWYAILLGAVWFLKGRVPRLLRPLEVQADQDAHHGEDEHGRDFATGIEKMYRENLIPAVVGKKPGSHPELYDRMIAAGVTPDYPRPEPPGKVVAGATLLVLLSVIIFAALAVGGYVLKARAGRSETAALTAIMFTGGDSRVLMKLAKHRARAGRKEEALVFRDAARAVRRR